MDGAAKAAILRRHFHKDESPVHPDDHEFGRLAVEAYMEARGVLDEAGDAPEKEHQNPDWVRRCVASVIHKGETDKASAPSGTDREATSRAFAICHAQHKKLSSAQKDSARENGKKWGKRMKQYDAILKSARRKS